MQILICKTELKKIGREIYRRGICEIKGKGGGLGMRVQILK